MTQPPSTPTVQTPERASAHPATAPFSEPIRWTNQAGLCCRAFPRAAWDARLYLVTDGGPTCDTDTLATVDDFGNLVATQRRDPQSLFGMAFSPVHQQAA